MIVQGKQVVIRGGRCFAVRKELSLTDRIANRGRGRCEWDRQMTKPAIRVTGTRSIARRSF